MRQLESTFKSKAFILAFEYATLQNIIFLDIFLLSTYLHNNQNNTTERKQSDRAARFYLAKCLVIGLER